VLFKGECHEADSESVQTSRARQVCVRERGNFSFDFPLTTSILISLLLTLILWWWRK
jgi:hypothetical protein